MSDSLLLTTRLLKTTEKYIQLLQAHGIKTVSDLLHYLPRTYEDRQQIKTLDQFENKPTSQSFRVCIVDKKYIPQWYKKRYEARITDTQGNQATAIWLNNNFTWSNLLKDQRYVMIAKPLYRKGTLTFWYPEFVKSVEVSQDDLVLADAIDHPIWSSDQHNVGRIYPVYSELAGIKSDRFAKKIRWLKSMISETILETLPDAFLKQYRLLSNAQAITHLHYPDTWNHIAQAKHRIYTERLLRMQLISQLNKTSYYSQADIRPPTDPHRDLIRHIISKLPFTLTLAQKKVIKQWIDDIHSGKPMMRLLQGDVWSGKTIVWAILAWYMIHVFDAQVAFVAPIEVLAQQHARSLAKLFLPLGIQVGCLTWSTKTSEKSKIKFDLQQGRIPVIVWTHALLQEDISFAKLGLVIIDEQHKFGVSQRSFFKQFGTPHILQMTATPIPRSLAMAYFWEFDVSVIDEMPAGRLPIQTKIITETEWNKLKPWVLTKIYQDQRVFVITPLISESEYLDDVKSALTEYESIVQAYPELTGQIWLLHGKVKSSDKDRIMSDFKSGVYKILVSTTVIEVGIDVPQASIIVIKNAERFGLSQLHQLRGRVGRSDIQSYCFLQTTKKWSDSYARLKHMEDTHDGFKLAEIDMKLRGPGELLWLRQSGETDVPLELLCDSRVITQVQEMAQSLLSDYPQLHWLDQLKHSIHYQPNQILI